MIDRGSPVPSVRIKLVGANGATDTTSDAVLGTGLVVFFAVPGAFTPTCHVNHLPGFVANEAKLRAAGVDRIVCAAVNDHHVMQAWAKASGGEGKIRFLADGSANLTRALGLEADMSAGGMGIRSKRYSMLIEDGKVTQLNVEDTPGKAEVSGAATLLGQV